MSSLPSALSLQSLTNLLGNPGSKPTVSHAQALSAREEAVRHALTNGVALYQIEEELDVLDAAEAMRH
jgi:DNA-binding NarL/FixJ family response regulator